VRAGRAVNSGRHSARPPETSLSMARRGAFELKEVVLRYSVDGGSSRGVREFIEHDLVAFARTNPQITIRTSLRNSHPFVAGQYGACLSRHSRTTAGATRRVHVPVAVSQRLGTY
jgi:hypothetical protein